jgi:hypothetical protein
MLEKHFISLKIMDVRRRESVVKMENGVMKLKNVQKIIL